VPNTPKILAGQKMLCNQAGSVGLCGVNKVDRPNGAGNLGLSLRAFDPHKQKMRKDRLHVSLSGPVLSPQHSAG
jgi:hypothetical protein